MNDMLGKILYDPLSYINEERFKINKELAQQPLVRSYFNDIIMEYYNLNDDDCGLNANTAFWVNNWYQISHIVYLAGSCLCKAELLRQGKLLQITQWANKFLTSSVWTEAPSVKITGEDSLQKQIIQAGYASIKVYIKDLPTPLKQRLALIFPYYIDVSITEIGLSYFMLRKIESYVKTNPCTFPIDFY